MHTFDYKHGNLLPIDRFRTLEPENIPESVLEDLRASVAHQLTLGPWTVVRDKRLAPSGDPHDYCSIAPYFWPNPDTPDGLP